ncbi:MAG: hypothetical protein FP826_02065 [Sphingomonadales bacterium]|nr:hypothetical protein [Sphingomonadales bacterium]MBU3991481.1 hypothetical protein [Alphaproteobacteria bacterium]
MHRREPVLSALRFANRPALALLAGCVLAVGGCSGGSEPPAGQSSDTPPVGAAESGAAAVPAGETATGARFSAAAIPRALRGRWGLVERDCTSTHGDAKGLLEVGANELIFYETSARLGTVAAAGTDRIRATFAFSGEGQEWTQDVELRAWDGGAKLIRQDRGPDAQTGPLTYLRCGG